MKKLKTSEELNHVGAAIKAARKKAGLTQKELADQLELIPVYICRGSISRIENGTRAITDIELAAIAKVLGVTPNDFFFWPPSK